MEAGVSGQDAPVGNGDTRPSEDPLEDCGAGVEGSGGFAHHLLGVLWWRGAPESQAIIAGSPGQLSVAPRQHRALAVGVTSSSLILPGLNLWTAFQEYS